jgi:hypothetical protein
MEKSQTFELPEVYSRLAALKVDLADVPSREFRLFLEHVIEAEDFLGLR